MPYDASASGAQSETAGAHRRGPMRPAHLKTVRTRLSGGALSRLFQVADMALIATVLIVGWQGYSQNGSVLWLAMGSAVTAATLVAGEAYKFKARERLHRHLGRVVGAAGGSALLLLAASSLIAPQTRLDLTAQIVSWCLITAGLLCAAHIAGFAYIRSLRRRGLLTPNLMIVGATSAAERLISAALASGDVNILGIFDDRGARSPKNIFGVPVLGKTADVKNHRLLPYVDRIVIAVPPGATARIAQLLQNLSPAPNAVSLLVEAFDPKAERAAHERILDMPLAHLSGAHHGAGQAVIKRMIDVSFSIAGAIVLAPALAAIAIAIRLESPGPILFKQRRHGYLNEEVVVWKFRSMRTEASDFTASRQVTADDDRVTRVGRFIRKTSLDELPQLWNVIRGEMSLVGPRPHAIGMLSGGDEASKLVETYAHRHRMKPGLTGWAAVNGSRGPVDTAEAVRRRVALDLEYVDRQNVWLDLMIIARTLPCVLGDSQTVR